MGRFCLVRQARKYVPTCTGKVIDVDRPPCWPRASCTTSYLPTEGRPRSQVIGFKMSHHRSPNSGLYHGSNSDDQSRPTLLQQRN